VVRGQRKGQWPYLLVATLEPARILAAKGLPVFRSRWTGGRGWGRACDLTQSAQLRRPTMEYLEKVRSQFLSLRPLAPRSAFSGRSVLQKAQHP
jgi:hypothetical protein